MPSQSAIISGLARPAERQHIDELVYVYAILPVAALALPPLICMDLDRPVYTLENKNFQVVVSRVRAQYFDQAALQENFQDAAWLETHVRIHQSVLDYVVATEHPVLPLRFCTIYRNEAAVQTMLAQHQVDLAGQLKRLQGKQEWGVKLFVNPAALQGAILGNHAALRTWQGNDDVALLQTQIAKMTRGAAFLFQKKLDAAITSKADTLAFAIADDSHRQLSACAVAAVSNPLRQEQPEMYLNAAYLVANTHLPAFRRALALLGETYQTAGINYVLSGPWPAYHFLNLNLVV